MNKKNRWWWPGGIGQRGGSGTRRGREGPREVPPWVKWAQAGIGALAAGAGIEKLAMPVGAPSWLQEVGLVASLGLFGTAIVFGLGALQSTKWFARLLRTRRSEPEKPERGIERSKDLLGASQSSRGGTEDGYSQSRLIAPPVVMATESPSERTRPSTEIGPLPSMIETGDVVDTRDRRIWP